MKTILLVATIALSLSACTQETRSRQILESHGYTRVTMTGYKPFACSDDDVTHDGFTATSPADHVVSGVVCGGVFKGSTIRF